MLVSPEAEWWVILCSCLGISVGTQLPYKLEADGDLIMSETFFFSPGVYAWEGNRDRIKAPLMGLWKLASFHSPGVNAWATEKSGKVGHYPEASSLDVCFRFLFTTSPYAHSSLCFLNHTFRSDS